MGLQTWLESRGNLGRVILVTLVFAFFTASTTMWHEYGHLMAARMLGVPASILSTALNQVQPTILDWRVTPIAYAGGLTVVLFLTALDLLIDNKAIEAGIRMNIVAQLIYGLAEGTWFLAWHTGLLGGHLWWTAYGLDAGSILSGLLGGVAMIIMLSRNGWLTPE